MPRPQLAWRAPNQTKDPDQIALEDAKARLSRIPGADTSWVDRAFLYKKQGHLNTDLFWMVHLSTLILVQVDRKPIYSLTKNIFDRCMGVLLVLILSPLLLVTAIAIKLTSRGPVFFKQLRVGYLGRPFWVFKFRTMRDNAEQGLRVLRPLEKIIADPRSTPFGRFLRRRKIDELPQLFNMIMGEMSMVGPRPLSLDESATTPPRRMKRFTVRPGLTGYWQANRPNTISGKKKLGWDARYARKCSWGLDIALILKTFRILVKGETDL
jgi:lipopolysaccharide/colanic/teichoic acid biosynthesis glycosyltransferase